MSNNIIPFKPMATKRVGEIKEQVILTIDLGGDDHRLQVGFTFNDAMIRASENFGNFFVVHVQTMEEWRKEMGISK